MKNVVSICNDLQTARIHAVHQGQIVHILVDIAMLGVAASIGDRRWSVSKTNRTNLYASTLINGRRIYLHRLLCQFPHRLEIDHRNGQGLDCRLKNLNVVTRQQNAAKMRLTNTPRRNNKLGVRGVMKTKYGKYSVSIRGKWGGVFPTLWQAAEHAETLRAMENVSRIGSRL